MLGPNHFLLSSVVGWGWSAGRNYLGQTIYLFPGLRTCWPGNRRRRRRRRGHVDDDEDVDHDLKKDQSYVYSLIKQSVAVSIEEAH
jgi:hypothetical protein